MNKNVGMVITFVAGIVVGVAATYKVSETKYRNMANDEIASVVDRFNGRTPMVFSEVVVSEEIVDKPKTIKKTSKPTALEYTNNEARVKYDTISETVNKKKNKKRKEEEEVKIETNDSIYVISPDEFNTLDGYSTETMYYSDDNYLLDSEYSVVPDNIMNEKIGHDPMGNFGEYEDDAVYVRNEALMCDYEILLSEKTCAEIRED